MGSMMDPLSPRPGPATAAIPPALPCRAHRRAAGRLIAGLTMLELVRLGGLQPEIREQLERLREASAAQLLGLLGLSLATLVINGLIF